MRKILFTAAMLMASLPFVQAQDTSKVTLKPYGFVRNYLSFDSRQMVTVCGGEYLMIPTDEDWNMTAADESLYGAGERFDRNAVPETHLLALSTRFGLALDGGRLLRWNLSGRVEGDFAGFGNNNTVLRLRLAYVRLQDGERQELLIGQDWHPLSGNVMPEVLGMAAGAPFRPHSRTPQVRYTANTSLGIGFSAAALWQFQYTSPGPDGESAKYANRSLVPELFVGVHYKAQDIYAQLGVDYTSLLIRQEIPVVDYMTNATIYSHLLEDQCHSFSPTVYFQYTPGLFSIKMRSTLAQNLAHLNMLSGYAWASRTGNEVFYTPVQSSVSYVDLSYGRRWRVNLFLGYQKNLGLADPDASIAWPVDDNLYMKKGIKNINSIYRVAPSVSYNTRAFNVGMEYELTGVTYGDIRNDASVDPKRQVLGHRVCLMVKYNF